MAREMRTTPDFILEQPRLQFAAHIRNVTPSAVSVPISLVSQPRQLSEDEYARLLNRNRDRVSLGTAKRAPRPSPVEPAEDISTDW